MPSALEAAQHDTLFALLQHNCHSLDKIPTPGANGQLLIKTNVAAAAATAATAAVLQTLGPTPAC